jgi:hypothetical protein
MVNVLMDDGPTCIDSRHKEYEHDFYAAVLRIHEDEEAADHLDTDEGKIVFEMFFNSSF